jgi:hypothetical protein
MAIQDGFSSDTNGDDRFDAVVGLMSMIDVITGRCPEGNNGAPTELNVEGWILGRAPYQGKPIDDPAFRRIAGYAWNQSLLGNPEEQREVREEYQNADSFEELSGIAQGAWFRARRVLSRADDDRSSEWPPFGWEAGPDAYKDSRDTSRLTRFRRRWTTRLGLFSRRIRKRRS